MTITVLDIRDQLKERWGLEFSRISHLINGLNSEAYISSDALVSETALSHRAVGQILQLLEPFLQQNDEGLQISPQHRAEISRLFPLDVTARSVGRASTAASRFSAPELDP